MQVMSSLRAFLELDVTPDADGAAATRISNRRRARVFAVVFFLVMLPGLAWNFLRPAEYRATARVEITPGSHEPRPLTPAAAGEAGQPSAPRAGAGVLTEVEVLTSRPLLEKVAALLASAGHASTIDGDLVDQLKGMIHAVPVTGTAVVELQATGAKPNLLAAALNALVDAYRDQMQASHEVVADDGLAQAGEEVARLGQAVSERRERLEGFRNTSGVVSGEREENDAVAHLKGLSTALNTATERAAIAESRLRALREGGGARAMAAKDDPTLAGMEQRASQVRQEIRELERTYTPHFMSLDPQARALRIRLSELERQIEVQRATGREAGFAAAEEDLASARATVERLQTQIRNQRANVQVFSQRFAQAKSLEDDLAQIEKAHRAALERLARLGASENSRLPALQVVEAASVPQSPFRPEYLRDALLVTAAAFALGLLAIWFVELFTRSPPAQGAATTTVVIPQTWPMPGHPARQLAGNMAGALSAGIRPPIDLLPDQSQSARELSQEEVAALLAASAGEERFLIALLMLGLTADEAIHLAQEDFDPAAGTLRVRGNAPRHLHVPPWLMACRAALPGDRSAPMLADAAGAPISAAHLQSVVICAAFDAGLADAASLTPEDLRHTCIAWLVRQGVRFSDLAALVGRPSAEALAAYAELASPSPRLAASTIDPLMPALRHFAS
jgi:succinoglycan biosynthesis transport protein ExoP